MRTVTTYDRYTHSASKTFICRVCGKRGKRSTTFSQTHNPFNLGLDGQPKTVQQIAVELLAKADAWTPDPVHARCEDE